MRSMVERASCGGPPLRLAALRHLPRKRGRIPQRTAPHLFRYVESPLPGLAPGIHVFEPGHRSSGKTWVAGSSPAAGTYSLIRTVVGLTRGSTQMAGSGAAMMTECAGNSGPVYIENLIVLRVN